MKNTFPIFCSTCFAKIATMFEKAPKNHKIQYDRAHETDYVIGDTAFSTVTINNNWRTALHQDAGDLKEGFGNLVILQEGDYDGGYLGFPQFKPKCRKAVNGYQVGMIDQLDGWTGQIIF